MEDLVGNNNQQGTTVFVIGLLSLVMCQLLGPVAFMMGNSYVAECRAAGVEPDGMGTAGRIMGIIASVFLVLQLAFVVLYVGMICCFFGLAILGG
jgi:hypothetical protein